VIDAFEAAAGQVKAETEGEQRIAASYQVRTRVQGCRVQGLRMIRLQVKAETAGSSALRPSMWFFWVQRRGVRMDQLLGARGAPAATAGGPPTAVSCAPWRCVQHRGDGVTRASAVWGRMACACAASSVAPDFA